MSSVPAMETFSSQLHTAGGLQTYELTQTKKIVDARSGIEELTRRKEKVNTRRIERLVWNDIKGPVFYYSNKQKK